MTETERLERLIADQVGECCAEDVDARVAELDELRTAAVLDRTDEHVAVFGALSNETRYRIVRLLAAADGELCVCEFDPLLDVSESAISHALSDLTSAGLVDRRKDGKWRYYRSTERAEALLDVLDDTEGER
ncbi:helix-turn-helix transcriptional regulator [Haloarchaeobius sp. HME9146]|uniref:ArsR/SmtB family transcription factor n=1 Tax=Haloarchaeobius sp. HME9146 TaxID=2978732 RepID=UPI0021BEEFF6|nr:metalloregulator ArsR/SmtB family transcription factor [Haloarchaeobius sp. HME9146]MCT9095557.1 metalloregulator ArsR/SmtB family transcription factor [Haloarchaeobius sp. HME9146]